MKFSPLSPTSKIFPFFEKDFSDYSRSELVPVSAIRKIYQIGFSPANDDKEALRLWAVSKKPEIPVYRSNEFMGPPVIVERKNIFALPTFPELKSNSWIENLCFKVEPNHIPFLDALVNKSENNIYLGIAENKSSLTLVVQIKAHRYDLIDFAKENGFIVIALSPNHVFIFPKSQSKEKSIDSDFIVISETDFSRFEENGISALSFNVFKEDNRFYLGTNNLTVNDRFKAGLLDYRLSNIAENSRVKLKPEKDQSSDNPRISEIYQKKLSVKISISDITALDCILPTNHYHLSNRFVRFITNNDDASNLCLKTSWNRSVEVCIVIITTYNLGNTLPLLESSNFVLYNGIESIVGYRNANKASLNKKVLKTILGRSLPCVEIGSSQQIKISDVLKHQNAIGFTPEMIEEAENRIRLVNRALDIWPEMPLNYTRIKRLTPELISFSEELQMKLLRGEIVEINKNHTIRRNTKIHYCGVSQRKYIDKPI